VYGVMDERELLNDLRELARGGPRQASAAVEARLRAEYRTEHKRVNTKWIALAAAALLVSLSGFYLGRRTAQPVADAESYKALEGFVALPYAQSGVPLEDAVVMRVNIKESELESMGIPTVARTPGRRVKADLLVGQDGMARAIRLVE
jgi:hypothetical protein